MTKLQDNKVRTLIKTGQTRATIRRKIKKQKIKISNKRFTELFKEESTTPILVKRFENARLNTKIAFKYFKRAKNPKRMINNFVFVVKIKITGSTSGTSESKLLVGYDRTLLKRSILRKIEESLEALRKKSPDIEVEFISIEGLFAKKGKF